MESFGFAYLEPWILDRAVIGRSIPFITPDFQAKGMKLGHLYNVLIVKDRDFKDIGKEQPAAAEALQERLDLILRLSDANFVARVLERNETPITATIKLLNFEKRRRLIVINKRRVETAFSQEIIGKQLYDVIMSPN